MAKKQQQPKSEKRERGPHEDTPITPSDLEKVAASLHELAGRMRVLASLVKDLPGEKLSVKSWKRFSEDLPAVIDIANKFHSAYNKAVMAGVPGFGNGDEN